MFGKTNHIHFIGIGGIGMSGMAELLHKLGFNISGSDQNRSERTDSLKGLGLTIAKGHSASNVNGADVVVYSSAVQQNNPEIINFVMLLHRSDKSASYSTNISIYVVGARSAN